MKKYGIIFLSLLLVGGLFGFYLFNKPHSNVRKTKVDYSLEAAKLFSEYEQDETKANDRYLDKMLEINGIVKRSYQNEAGVWSVELDVEGSMFAVVCQLDEHSKHKRYEFETGETVRFKGLCTGVLMDVVIIRCIEL